ncbi:MAG: histidinol-phosphate transaminase [Candidatus Diapherotrites archaeon]|nr:histidinol-phosphate transaminase [Candidatus Diapherotrites archaeon]
MIQFRKEITKMKAYSPPLEGRENYLCLDFNEKTIQPSKKILKQLQKMDFKKLNQYPSYSKAINALAKYWKISTEQVLLTNGSNEAIKVCMDAAVGVGNEILLMTPSYKMYEVYGQASFGKIKKIKLNADYSFPVKKIIQGINKKTALIIICNPNSPTGTMISKKELEQVLKKAKNALVLVDEAYGEFNNTTCIGLTKKYGNLGVVKTLAKAYGLAGIRLGYIIGNQKIIQELKKVKAPYTVNTIAADIIPTALTDQTGMKRYVQEIQKSKKILYKKLKKEKISFTPSKTNFVLIDFREKKDLVFNGLKNEKVLVRDVSQQLGLTGCLRITVGTVDQTKYLIQKLDQILNKPLLIFDLDGVLIDVTQSYRKAIQKTVQFFTGKKIKENEIQELKNTGNYNNDWKLSQKLIQINGKKVKFEKVRRKFQEYYLGKNWAGLILSERILVKLKLLEKLSEQYSLSIFTGRPKKEALFALNKLGLARYFKEIICLEDTGEKMKPNPFGLNLILKKYNRKNAIYIGDSMEDIWAAKKAGIQTIGIAKRKEKKLKKLFLNEKIQVIENVNQIEKVLP